MLLLERTKSSKLIMLESLMRRLAPADSDYSYFKESYQRQVAGFEGEKFVDREWFDMPNLGSHYLFFNYEFENKFGFPHQIDTLLLTTKFLLILEIKNISGQVDIDEDKHQMIITRPDGTLKSYRNPLDQIRRHSQHLILLTQLNVSLPIVGALVFSNPATIIGNVPKNFPIFHSSGLRFFVQKLLKNYPEILQEKRLEKLSGDLLSKLKRQEVKPTINLSRIKKGVLCENCHFQIEMKYQGGLWHCAECGCRNKKSILQAFHDYRVLVSNKITNSEFREFFGIESIDAASKILIRLGIETVGEKRGRHYLIPPDIFTK
ncbi:nuclease-related domain-containing protein [Ureibacillus acetophenoni]|uniref:Nuclease-like protein n=1 Tax=Ureibacillus acetophenoni TaxID=614649 RepID=A0A285UE87_9BACL|nr:nuclease-related domain-containing protein [Ureibacillus acetophenoni]SOC40235.1 nuclease-like protein [Ureibacillus acetophenoni]